LFKEIRKIWGEDDLLKQAFEETSRMLDKNMKLFKEVSDSLIKGTKPRIDVYREDKKINKYDMDIRKKVLEHLSINSRQDVVSSLILIGVSRDAERIGDFSKNIFELAEMYDEKFSSDRHFRELVKARDTILDNIGLTKKAFEESDTDAAQKVMERHHKEIKINLDKMLNELMKCKNGDCKNAVVCSLFSRYLKRISAHTMNIASTVVNPFHKVRYQERNNNDL